MNNKKMILIAASVAGVLLAGFTAYKLYSGISNFGAAEQTLAGSIGTLKTFYEMNPFPSQGNIQIDQTSIEVLNNWQSGLTTDIKEMNILPGKKTPATFMKHLDDMKVELAAVAKSKGVQLPAEEDFHLGFGLYSAGNLPTPSDVFRLNLQAYAIENLTTILLEEGVDEIVSVSREEFEKSTIGQSQGRPGRSGRTVRGGSSRRGSKKGGKAGKIVIPATKDAGNIGPNDIYGKLHFAFQFKAREEALLKILNRFAQDNMFVVVTRLDVQKKDVLLGDTGRKESKSKSVSSKPKEEAVDDAPEEMPRRIQRVVAGRSIEIPMDVVIEVDVYRFK